MLLRVSPLVLIAACALLRAAAASAQIEVTVPLGPIEDPEIARHIEGITGPRRRVQLPVLARGGRDTVPRVVEIVGTLTNDDLESLVRLTGYYNQSLNTIIGDQNYASTRCGPSCGPNCTRDIRFTFQRVNGRWKLLYRIDS